MLPDQIHQWKKIANICDFGTVKYQFQSHRYLQYFEKVVNICDLGTDSWGMLLRYILLTPFLDLVQGPHLGAVVAPGLLGV